jgi:hypothetical protein
MTTVYPEAVREVIARGRRAVADRLDADAEELARRRASSAGCRPTWGGGWRGG